MTLPPWIVAGLGELSSFLYQLVPTAADADPVIGRLPAGTHPTERDITTEPQGEAPRAKIVILS